MNKSYEASKNGGISVKLLKQQIAEENGFPIKKIKLIKDGRKLADDAIIFDTTTLHCVVNLSSKIDKGKTGPGEDPVPPNLVPPNLIPTSTTSIAPSSTRKSKKPIVIQLEHLIRKLASLKNYGHIKKTIKSNTNWSVESFLQFINLEMPTFFTTTQGVELIQLIAERCSNWENHQVYFENIIGARCLDFWNLNEVWPKMACIYSPHGRQIPTEVNLNAIFHSTWKFTNNYQHLNFLTEIDINNFLYVCKYQCNQCKEPLSKNGIGNLTGLCDNCMPVDNMVI